MKCYFILWLLCLPAALIFLMNVFFKISTSYTLYYNSQLDSTLFYM